VTFALPLAFAALLAVPALVGLYLLLDRRRKSRAAELASKGFVPTAAALKLRARRHVPYVFFISGLTVLLFGLARPQMNVSIPRREGTVILAFDVSNSMRAKDLEPTRMDAAKVAANAFVAKQPSSIKIGVVAFSDGALVTQQPTKDRKAVLAAIDRMKPQGGTSLGQGIFTSLGAIAGKPIKVDPSVFGDPAAGPTGAPAATPATPTTDAGSPANPDAGTAGSLDSVDIGYYGSAAIVLLSDGENTSQPDPKAVAELASTAGVKIYAVGIGSAEGAVIEVEGFQVATALDEPALQDLAKVTNGTYYRAADAKSLKDVYGSIDLKWRSVSEKREITGVLAGLGALLFAIGSALSLWWFGRLV
jgi:Ca-activated chloride channel homolog